MADDRVASDAIDEYFKNAAPLFDCGQQVKTTAAAMELLRLVSGAAVVTKSDPQLVRIGMIDLIGQLCGLAWERVPFSLTKTALTVKDPNCDVIGALKTFANLLEIDPGVATEEVFRSLLAPDSAPAPLSPPPAAKQVKRAPALVNDKTVLSVFTPAKFSPDGSPACSLLSWQSEYPHGGLGPQLAAIGLERNEQSKVLLETGEFVWIPDNSFLLAQTVDAHDYAMTPVYLLACARALAPLQWLVDPPIPDSTLDARFGQFTKPLVFCPYGTGAVKALQDVFDNPDAFAYGNSTSTTLTVDGTPYSVTLDARVSKTGPYVTAKLLDCNENVVMRLDTPRQFSPRGVYLFPAPETAIALVIQ